MTKAHRSRLLIDLAGMALALGTLFALQNFWLGMIAAAAIFFVTHALAEWAFTRLASAEEIKADLSDRNKNGP